MFIPRNRNKRSLFLFEKLRHVSRSLHNFLLSMYCIPNLRRILFSRMTCAQMCWKVWLFVRCNTGDRRYVYSLTWQAVRMYFRIPYTHIRKWALTFLQIPELFIWYHILSLFMIIKPVLKYRRVLVQKPASGRRTSLLPIPEPFLKRDHFIFPEKKLLFFQTQKNSWHGFRRGSDC